MTELNLKARAKRLRQILGSGEDVESKAEQLKHILGSWADVHPWNFDILWVGTPFKYANGDQLALFATLDQDKVYVHDMGGTLVHQALRLVGDDDATRRVVSAYGVGLDRGFIGNEIKLDGDVVSGVMGVIAACLAVDGAAVWVQDSDE